MSTIIPAWHGSLISQEVLDAVLAQVQAETGVAPREARSAQKTRRIAHARQYAMWKLRKFTKDGHPKYALTEIGYVFGRDHSTVMHAIERVESRLAAQAVAA